MAANTQLSCLSSWGGFSCRRTYVFPVVGRWPFVVRNFRFADDRQPMTDDCLHQDDFETPGISPRSANPRKHRRHRPNLRRYARGRPQILQRLCLRVENFGFLASLTRFAVVAKTQLLALPCRDGACPVSDAASRVSTLTLETACPNASVMPGSGHRSAPWSRS